ncbi:hypothetical protein [Pelagibius sp.]|uniref:WD40/YVTN/BNR-like repeat-containing protein n=1 Tax=Pelagibius sp. TaxID=1931238 RepID=UPI00262CF582|nr:hypothetical protein [Pelagibius sp.]
MAEDLLIATRKGLFALDSGNAGAAPRCLGFLGDPVSSVLYDPRDGTLYAALNLGHFGHKLHRSDDFGTSWQELAPPAFTAAGNGESGGDKAPSVNFVWTLVAGGSDQPGRLWAGTLPGALFRSDDRGESWHLIESLWNQPSRKDWFGGGYDDPGIHSIIVDPQDSRKLTVGISCGGVWLSEDGGESWQLGGKGLAADYMPPDRIDDPSIQDPHRLAVCAADPSRVWCQHHCGIFRSDDGGRSFVVIDKAAPSGFGFAVVVHPAEAETAWFVPAVKDECRVPVDGRFVVTRTRDGGASFEALSQGLPQGTAYDLVYRHALDVDGRGERLAMGSTTGALWLGQNGGETWSLLSAHFPPINQVAFRET